MEAKKIKTSTPVVIVEDHNDVLQHIYRFIGSKKIPFTDGIMVHLDSHPDLVVPRNLDPQKIFDKEYVLSSLSIENWIMPAIYARHFKTVMWIKPEWSTQFPNGSHRFKIGLDKMSGEMKVTNTESYYVGELSWCPESDLESGSSRDVELEVVTLKSSSDPTAGDTDCSALSALDESLKQKLESTSFVLDIDLDFYSTKNPFLELFTEEQFGMLKELYHYEHPANATEEVLRDATAKRRSHLAELKSIIESINDGVPLLDTPLANAVRPLLGTFPHGEPPDPEMLIAGGCTCDDCALPHNVSTRDEVRRLVAESERFLRCIPRPALITIARSTRDDYCPPEDADFIQDCVLHMLADLYGAIEVAKDYEDDGVLPESNTATEQCA